MGARIFSGRSRDSERDAETRRVARRLPPLPSLLRRPAATQTAIAALALAVAFVAVIAYYGARTFTGRAADERAANEATSFAAHSGKLATGDAFDGYIQILRYAEDPVLTARAASARDRSDAMQRLLYLNTNKFSSLTIADRSGIVLATTEPSITGMRDSFVFAETRANLGPANSDVVLPSPGSAGYVEYGAPLHDPDGAVWAFLIARGDPARLFTPALAATVDGSRNVIINSQGEFAAGVPDASIGQPWRGSSVGDGGIRANIDGVDSICGLAPIGRDTQIDRGLNVASCLPATLIQVEHAHAMGKQGLVTLAAAVLAVVLGAGLLRLAHAPRVATSPAPREAAEAQALPPEPADLGAAFTGEAVSAPDAADPAPADAPGELDAGAALHAADEPGTPDRDADREPAPDPPEPLPSVVVNADVDALALIEAFEERNARLATRLRDGVQARLLIAATRATEAFRAAGEDHVDAELEDAVHARARELHELAMQDIDDVRQRELRAIGQELHPGLVRLGLPGALRALAKDLADEIGVTLDVDPAADRLGAAGLPPPLRLALYRFALEASRVVATGDEPACTVTVRRHDGAVSVAVASEGTDARIAFDRRLTAMTLALEAYGGTVEAVSDDTRVSITATVLVAEPAVIAEDAQDRSDDLPPGGSPDGEPDSDATAEHAAADAA